MHANEDHGIEAAEPPTCNVAPAQNDSETRGPRAPAAPYVEDQVRASPPPLAIVGMATRLPGGVNSIPDMYKFLDGEFPYSMRTRRAYFLDDDIAMMDASFFGSSELEASGADPRARLLLEVVYECLENAGEPHYRGKNIGCYVGAWGVDWCELTLKDGQQRNPLLGAAAGSFFISSYIAWNLDLHGPSMTIETACSSSMVALHEACQAIYSGECTSAVVGSANLILTPTLHMNLASSGVLSTSGLCKTFDTTADGFGRGEAVNAILVKRLDDAIRDGDVVRAVIRATSVNNDGRTALLTTPSADAQEELIRAAYAKAGIDDIQSTAYFECHGTGTQAGDTTETSAVTRVFPEGIHLGRLTVTKAKPNFGHSEGASGITSMIKAVISLENKVLLPHILMKEPNPKIPFESSNLMVPQESSSWPEGRKERISVNNFGVGGTNVHVILDSASSLNLHTEHNQPSDPPPHAHLLVVSANTEKSLTRRTDNIKTYLDENPKSLRDLAFTLGERREHLAYRAFSLATEGQAVGAFTVSTVSCDVSPEITFVFTGQGAQWPAMGKELIETFDIFRTSIQRLDQALQKLSSPPTWTLEGLLCTESNREQLDRAELAQPLCCALQIGLVDLLLHWGIAPSSVIGHSSGEIAAAYAARGLTAEAAIMVAYHRGDSLRKIQKRGGMAAVGRGREAVTPYLMDGVIIACENSSQSLTLSGDYDKLTQIVDKIKEDDPDTLCRLLRVDKAYHSHHMQEAADRYETALQALWVKRSSSMIPMFSTVNGTEVTDPSLLSARYWRQNLECPVLFLTGTRALLDANEEEKTRVFVEIGPHSALSGPLRQILSEHPRGGSSTYIPSLVRGEDPTTSLLYTAGNMYNSGIPVDLRIINGEGSLLVDLPPYPWQHDTRYWNQGSAVEAWRMRKYPHHEILGSRVLGSTETEPSWRNTLALDDAPWLYGHRVIGKTLFPGAGYIAMAGEAIQQITSPPTTAYQISHLLLKHALFIDSNECVELVTNLRPVRISDIEDSRRYDFSITCVQGGETTRLCTGQIRAVPESVAPEMPLPENTEPPRQVNAATWYKALRTTGLDYSREFRGLDEVYADPVRYEATATLKKAEVSASRYVMHPATIDRCLQLLSVAIFRGLSRNMDTRCLPILFEDLFVGPEPAGLRIQAQADPPQGNFIHGNIGAMSDGKTLLSVKGARLHIFADDGSLEQEREFAARPVWMPHIDFIPASAMNKSPMADYPEKELLPRVVDLCIAETASKVLDIEPVEDHHKKYKSWLMTEHIRIEKQRPWRPFDMGYAVDCPFDSSNRTGMIEWLNEQIDRGEYVSLSPFSACTRRVMENITEIFAGTRKPLGILMEDDVLRNLYDALLRFDNCAEFFGTLGHSNSELNILEVGAGTGSGTATFLDYLHAPDGSRLYSQYTFTDISAGFLTAAKERFGRYDGMEYAIFDITKDPAEQGFKLGSYDLIIASNVIHATPNLSQSLANIKVLLSPGGRLFLQELSGERRDAEYIFGLLPGWWVGENDRRSQRPYVSVERWEEELKVAGFGDVEFSIHEQRGMVVSLVVQSPKPARTARSVNLLVPEKPSKWISEVQAYFEKHRYQVNACSLSQAPSLDGNVISLLDAARPCLFDIDPTTFQQLKDCIRGPNVKHVLWVTKSSQLDCTDPRYGLTQGFVRVFHGESYANGTSGATLEIDSFDREAIPHLFRVYEHASPSESSEEARRDEYALHKGLIHAGRLESMSVDKELRTPPKDEAPRRLGLATPGLLDSFFWREDVYSTPGAGEVRLQVKYVGLNFKDIITALGLIASPDQLGLEGSGIVQSVGPGVSHVRPGDRVVFLGPGSFATHLTIPAMQVYPLPDGWTLEEGATSPVVAITAGQCLLNFVKVRRGQSVLIHSACGGVGLAAIRICRAVGAKIYATVGSEEKVQYLMETYGIPRSCIFHSRDASFYSDLMSETRGRGADYVLSSLSGELLQTSWKCVAPGGTMFDISRRDVLADAMLPMRYFQERKSFITLDLTEYTDGTADDLPNFTQSVDKGFIGPISPVTCYDASEISAAFRHMQTGQHMGKIVVRMPESPSELAARETRADVTFSPDHAYLLSGGLGGLGRAISNWMVEKGARCLVYLSPSAGVSDTHRPFAEELKCQGCEAIFVSGSAAGMADIRRAISLSPKPIKGVFQLALVLQDRTLERMAFEDWRVPLIPKVDGTWNLHRAFESTPLDFFVMFGSVAGTIGMLGQANYAAANTYISSLARYRQSLGLPASVLDLGPVADIGFVARNPELVKALTVQLELPFIQEREMLDAIEALIERSSSPGELPTGPEGSVSDYHYITLGIVTTASWLLQRHDRRLSILINRAQKEQDSTPISDDVGDFVMQVEADPEILNNPATEEFLIEKVGMMIKSPTQKAATAKKVDIKTLSNIPIDSLIAIEARAWARKRLGVQISLSDITAAGNVKGLVNLAIDELKKRYQIA
ncbi:polyketide synthase [Aspergillus ustus]|uniref:Polyketide synthase n=1 Tax=Aspergillus ustus TaxID=40382 RepID=A0A0C1EGU0_ASPUT|nr:polyketide synthase [Aspergillus ustus]